MPDYYVLGESLFPAMQVAEDGSQGWEPGGLPPMGSHRVGHDGRDLAAAAAEDGERTQASHLFPASSSKDINSIMGTPPSWPNDLLYLQIP